MCAASPHVASISAFCCVLPLFHPSQKLVTTVDGFMVQNKWSYFGFHIKFSSLFYTIIILNFSQQKTVASSIARVSRFSLCVYIRRCSVLTDEPVNIPGVSDISWSLLLWVQICQVWVVYLVSRYQMKPATLSHNHMCIPSVWPCSNSFVESINSHAWTCSHKYTTLSSTYRN